MSGENFCALAERFLAKKMSLLRREDSRKILLLFAALQAFHGAEEHDDAEGEVQIQRPLGAVGGALGDVIWQRGLAEGDQRGSNGGADGAGKLLQGVDDSGAVAVLIAWEIAQGEGGCVPEREALADAVDDADAVPFNFSTSNPWRRSGLYPAACA